MSNSSPPVIVVSDSASHASALTRSPAAVVAPSDSADAHNGAGVEGTDPLAEVRTADLDVPPVSTSERATNASAI